MQAMNLQIKNILNFSQKKQKEIKKSHVNQKNKIS